MSVTTPSPAQPRRPQPSPPAAPPTARVGSARRRATGASLGPLPVTNVVVLEVGLAVGLLLLAVSTSLWPASAAVLLVALVVAFTRWKGRWLTQWTKLTLGYAARSHTRVAHPPARADDEEVQLDDKPVTGPEDARVSLLRLALPDLVVAQGTDHERGQVGLAMHDGTWTAVLLVEPPPALVTHVGAAPNLPLGALTPCLEDRGVILDSIKVIWHCYPGSAALPPNSPALNSYLEVLGPLPAAARRTTWVAVRLDPRRCQQAITERGGGVVGAHRALIGALSRIRSALERHGVSTRPLDVDEVLRSGISAANLQSVAGANKKVGLRERWTGVTAGGVGHASYAITRWPGKGGMRNINALTGVRALSSTVTLSISPSEEDGKVGLRGLVRVSARTPSELEAADGKLNTLGEKLDITLTPLRGLQVAGLAATLPLGGSA
ncbi:type VII secretion protein EccE [Actinoalloteichus cyanogriseus DSM 43889]|uniref:Type VII secretion protein EccE n=1 Tax=Actinoalloteichus caeruleus DSM 43889 TaxID=1120930 RepID=A0ABT1JMU0_ACTCY|nr:type VII secretion protein EccE [Actinoalloteichus caeruleus]MCP2333451.1 type VII secretion protein EccE [Actinoalloteichus caeruleus DSM 43889]